MGAGNLLMFNGVVVKSGVIISPNVVKNVQLLFWAPPRTKSFFPNGKSTFLA